MSEFQEVEALSTKIQRRKLTPEQRIAERKAEIERIEARQREKVLDLIDDALDVLRDAQAKADAWGMAAEGQMIVSAIKALDASA